MNADGYWQSFNGVKQPKGESRPAWKILRVLGNLLKLDGFEYMSSEQARDECRALCENIELINRVNATSNIEIPASNGALKRCSDVPMYAADALVRRAKSLQQTSDVHAFEVSINSNEATRLGLDGINVVHVKQDDLSAELKLVVDDSIPDGSAWLPQALHGNELLGHPFGDIVIEKAQS